VNGTRAALTSQTGQTSDVNNLIGLLQPVMEQYIVTSRRFAVRMALQGGLKDFAPGIIYDAGRDVFTNTTDRQLAPMFEGVRARPARGRASAVASNDNETWPERPFHCACSGKRA
jgi:hypothetical protein